MRIYRFACPCAHTHTCTHAHTHMHTHTCTHVHTHTHTRTHTHAHTCTHRRGPCGKGMEEGPGGQGQWIGQSAQTGA